MIAGFWTYTGNDNFLIANNDDLVFKNKIFGYSEKGKPIYGYEAGTGEKALLLIGAIHGDEYSSADVLNRLVQEVKSDPDMVAKSKRVIIIPVSNPDGYYDAIYKMNANEVNLNLNFQTSGWQNYGPEGTYAGPAPFSEAESQTIRRVVERYKPELFISFHAFGSLVSPEHGTSSEELARWYAEKTGYIYFTDWKFDYPGTATKWFREAYDKPAITVELSEKNGSDWDINKNALFELISEE